MDNVLLQPFNPIKADIEKMKAHNAALTFDYESGEGNKAARSHIFTLRKVKARIADAHKTAKADALEVCRILDGYKRDLTAEVDTMIEVHDAPLREIEQREARRIAEEQARIEREKAEAERKQREEMEARQRELDRREAELRAKEEAQRKAEREAQIAKEAEERAKRAAQDQIERERIEAQRRIEQAEREKQAAIQAERDRIERERKAAEAKAEAERIAEEKRQANKKHRAKIEQEAAQSMPCAIATAAQIIEAIKAGTVKYITINY